jgi:ABC transport system ATP-binding/permease protein
MALLSLRELSISFGGPPILDQIDLQLEPDERIGLVGRNGEGKSTLMKLINGDLSPDSGQIARETHLRTARLDQDIPPEIAGITADVVAAGLPHPLPDGPPASQRIDSILTRLQLDPQADFAALSGGLKRRVLLARALVSDPDVLLLDEPTNHLDIDAIAWIENFLLRCRATLVFVTHDRAFLRRLATRIVEIDRGGLFSFPCDYDAFLKRRESRLQSEAIAEADFDRKLAEEEVWIRQGIKARRTRNEGRVRALQNMRSERSARRQKVGSVHLQIQEATRSGDLVAQAKDLSFSYEDSAPVIRDFSALIMRGDRIGVVGPNGSGKTTLLRLLLGQLTSPTGHLRHGTRLEVVHYDQFREQLDLNKSVAENIAGGQEYFTIDGRRRHVYGYLQDFLFTPQRARTPVSVLSGGERNRLLLARLFTRPANLLILDEPTNDLDIETLELLEERLLAYAGTLILVSHDRDFLDNVVTSTLVLEGEGKVHEYVGGYSDYIRQRQPEPESTQKAETKPKPQRQQQRPRRLGFKEKRELETLPAHIEALEEEQEHLHQQLADPAFYQQQDGGDIARAQERLQELETELEATYARWGELSELED